MSAPDPREEAMPDPLTVLHIQARSVRILDTVRRHDAKHGNPMLVSLIKEHGEYLSVAFAAWCDAAVDAIAAMGLDAVPSTELIQTVCRMEAEESEDRQWAGKLLKARADDDKQTYLDCLAELNTQDGKGRWDRIVALMATTATTISACEHVTAAGWSR